MLSIREIERFLTPQPRAFQEIVLELRNIIAEVAPDASETISWKSLAYYLENRGGPISAGICLVGFEPDCVQLGFIHGAFIPDPKHLLEGTRKAKRFMRIFSFEEAPWDDIRNLIIESARFDPRTLPQNQKKSDQ